MTQGAEQQEVTSKRPRARRSDRGLLPDAREIRNISIEKWGANRAIEIFGTSPAMRRVLADVQRFARFKEPILIFGESGVGKEAISAACHLVSPRSDGPFETVNCPQYQDGNMTVSEMFGHVKGSFTGAIGDHKGHFETARGGSVFLDEVADLPMAAQTMLLRTLAQQEFKPLGGERIVRTNVRIIAATNRPLSEMIHSGEFREDLYFRLRFFPVEIPPLREREDDWSLLMDLFLDRLAKEYDDVRALSPAAEELLRSYTWPGNVRELRSVAFMGYGKAHGSTIEPEHIADCLRRPESVEDVQPIYTKIYLKIVKDQKDFWEELYLPFMGRDINRTQARAVVRRGLVQTRGSYRNLIKLFNVPESDYQRFMDFLRHQKLKPDDLNRRKDV